MSLHPTKTRIALLNAVRVGHVRYGRGPDGVPGRRREPGAWNIHDPFRGPQKVTAAIAEMERAGWVERPDRTAEWQLTPLGRAVHGVRLMDYGTHAVAETGPVDDPTVLGEMRPDLADPGRWVVLVGADAATGLRRQLAVASLRGMATAALVDLITDDITAGAR
ncbi:hypothetical protein ACGFI9_37400 [Micromonospora sp. NPDC048930]|uniref:hypothetical protein n=1 Tax=Micromonospora sp. NPDC048930 TaxID=3364261 RepID=UPI003713E8AE